MDKFETDQYIVEWDDSKEIKDKVFKRLIEYYVKHKQFSGEGIMQMDNPIIDAPIVLSDIADDIIKFNQTWKNDE